MDGLSVRDDHPLERELEQLTQRWQRSFLVRRARPDAKLALRRRQRISEDEGALLRQPERRLVAAPAVVEGDESAGELAVGLDGVQLALRDIRSPEKPRAECARAVAADEKIDVAHVIGLEHDDEGGRARI